MIGYQNSRHFLNQWEAEKPYQNQSWHGRTRFPTLGAGHVHLLWILIGPLCCLRFFVIGQSNYFGFGFTKLNWKPV